MESVNLDELVKCLVDPSTQHLRSALPCLRIILCFLVFCTLLNSDRHLCSINAVTVYMPALIIYLEVQGFLILTTMWLYERELYWISFILMLINTPSDP